MVVLEMVDYGLN